MKAGPLIRLALACVLVGVILHELGIAPRELSGDIGHWFARAWESVLRFIAHIPTYLVSGAVVVVPIYGLYWLLARRR